MKFEDLTFSPHPSGMGGVHARHDFENDDEYEVAIFKDGALCYDTYITNDVLGHQSEDDITKVLGQVENLKDK